MKTSFNLKSFRKHAYYDGGRGLTQEMTRACMNCQKEKREKGVGAQEAWFSCIDEYNNQKNGEWSLKYASKKVGLMKKAQMDTEEIIHIQGLIQKLKDLKKEYFGEGSVLEDEVIIEGDPQGELEGLIFKLEGNIIREKDASLRESAEEGDPTAIAMFEQ